MSDPILQHPQLERLRGFQFDIFQRFAALARALDAMFPGDAAVRVLDCGCGATPLTAAFLPARFEVTRADVDDFGDRAIVRIAPGAPLPFGDGAFDVAIAMDVLEHVPAAARPALVAELARVATACALAFPSGEADTGDAETAYGRVYAAAFGTDNAFLREHLEHGLPSAAEVGGWFGGWSGRGLAWQALPNAPLDEWLLWNALDALYCARVGDGAQKAAFNARANALCDGPVAGARHYRSLVVAARAPDLLTRAAASQPTRPQPASLAAVVPLLISALVELEGHDRAGRDDVIAAKDAHIAALQAVADGMSSGLAAKDAHIAGLQRTADELAAAVRGRRMGPAGRQADA